jgi:glycosyltransferase involved in cell wall biosynthesis
MAKRVLIVANVGWAFLMHRMPVALAAKNAGYEVHVATALDARLDAKTPETLAAAGLVLHRTNFSRGGVHPIEVIRDLLALIRIYREVRPDVVHLVTMKPVLFGGLVCRLLGHKATVFAIPGRGLVFSATGFLGWLRRKIVVLTYRLCYRPGRSRVIVQNVEDRDYFIENSIFRAEDVRLIRGAGVDVSQFEPLPEPTGKVTVVLASRMLREKGISDFVDAARLLKQQNVDARFVLVGEPDAGNPHSHTDEELAAWAREGIVEWLGLRTDIPKIFASAHIICLPTYYGEGVPKVLIEAAAAGRAIVTTNIPGCRDIVRHEDNGLLVRPRDVPGLATALRRLIEDPATRRRMGESGRRRVEQEFTVQIVTAQTLAIYREQESWA